MFDRSVAGFVLVGGSSVRMGRDKALLPFGGQALAQHVAAELGQVANPVCLVGRRDLYEGLALPVVPDAADGRGPLSGMEAALLSPFASEWNLIVACDMPRLTAALLRSLTAAIEDGVDCVVPRSTAGKLEPLCALYRNNCAPVVSKALEGGTRRVVDVVAMLQAKFWQIHDGEPFQNVNTAPEWDRFLNDR